MAYKQKINPRTGKFNLVTPEQEGGIKEVTSVDESVEVNPSGDGVDLSVPLVTEENHGRERKFDKLVRNHSLMNIISVDSSNSYPNGEEANASLIAADSEYYPVAGQMVEYISNTDGRLHIARYNGNFLINRDGTNEYWCGATYDILNKCWLVNRNVAGAARLRVARSSSGLFWQITDYEASSMERRVMICSTSYASLIMSGNESQEYDITYDGGDTLWQHLTVPRDLRYRSVKRSFIKIEGELKEVFLFNENNSVHALDANRTFTTLIGSTNSLLYQIGGYNVSPYPSNGLCDETDWFVDGNGKNNVLILWNQNTGNPNSPYHITWLRQADTELGWEEVTTYSIPTDYAYLVMTIHYENGRIYAYSGERAENNSRYACILQIGNDSISFDSRYDNTSHLIPTSYGLVQVKGSLRQVYVDGEAITMPAGVTHGAFYSVAYDGNEDILLVTGGTQYSNKTGNYGLILNVAKKRIENDNSWEEIGLVTEEHEGIITAKEGKIKAAQFDEYLHYNKSESKLSANASDRTTAYANYLCLGTDTDDGWCPVALTDIVDNSTKLYSDEACTVELGTITAHQYNPNNPEDLAVDINGVSHRFVHVADKTPVSLATTKALLSLFPSGAGMTRSADNATDSAFHNLAEHLALSDSKIWDDKIFSGLASVAGQYIWSDGTDTYYSNGTAQYVLNKSTSTWSVKTWTGLTSFYGLYIWSDGTDTYYSNGASQYVLNKTTSTWSAKTWTGATSFYRANVWTDGTDIYLSEGNSQYVLNKTTSTWSAKTWTGLTSFYGQYVWTDGTDIYITTSSVQKVLNSALSSDSEFAFHRSTSEVWKKVRMSDIAEKLQGLISPIVFVTSNYYGTDLRLFPRKARFFMDIETYSPSFTLWNLTSFTQNSPFRIFGRTSSDSMSGISFEDKQGHFFSFSTTTAKKFHTWSDSFYLFEFWLIDDTHAQLRVTNYPDGYDGLRGDYEIFEDEYIEPY